MICRKNTPLRLTGIVLIGTAAFSAARAHDPGSGNTNALPGGSLTLDQAFRIALAANPDIRVASLEADRAGALVDRARGQFDPVWFAAAAGGENRGPLATVPLTRANAEDSTARAGVRKRLVTGTEAEISSGFTYGRDGSTSNDLDPEYAGRASFTVRQDLLRDFGPRVNRTGIMISRNNAAISREALRNEIIQRLFDVERVYWDLFFALADVRVRDQQLQRARALVRIAEARVGVGDAPPIEVTRALSSAAIQAVEIRNARSRATKLRHRLLRTMGILDVTPADQAFDLADTPAQEPVAVTLAEALLAAGQQRPDLAQAEQAIAIAALEEDFTRNQRLPSLQLYGNVSLLGLDDEADAVWPDDTDYHDWEIGLLLELPLPNRAARANYRAARLAHRQARERARALRQTATREVADAIEDLQAAADRAVSSAEALELARRLLEAEETSFSLGRTESFNVLDAQAALASAERDDVRARTDYATALANLYRVRGDLLEVKQVTFVPGTPLPGKEETPR